MRWQEGQEWETLQSKWNSARRARWASIRLPESVFTGETSLFLYQRALQQSMHLHDIQTSGMFVRQCMELPSNVHLQHVYIHHLQKYLNEELSGSPLHVVETSKQLQREWPERRSVSKKNKPQNKTGQFKGLFHQMCSRFSCNQGLGDFCLHGNKNTHTHTHSKSNDDSEQSRFTRHSRRANWETSV